MREKEIEKCSLKRGEKRKQTMGVQREMCERIYFFSFFFLFVLLLSFAIN